MICPLISTPKTGVKIYDIQETNNSGAHFRTPGIFGRDGPSFPCLWGVYTVEVERTQAACEDDCCVARILCVRTGRSKIVIELEISELVDISRDVADGATGHKILGFLAGGRRIARKGG